MVYQAPQAERLPNEVQFSLGGFTRITQRTSLCPALPGVTGTSRREEMQRNLASHSMSLEMGAGAGMVGTGMGVSSELIGGLGDIYAVYNPFHGPYHPDYLDQKWVPPSMAGVSAVSIAALPFSGVGSVNGEATSNSSSSNACPTTRNANNGSNASADLNANTHTSATCRTVSVAKPPSSAGVVLLIWRRQFCNGVRHDLHWCHSSSP
ncbi:uncharacterized protein EDB91DRAFT_1091101 [Suillus paluster]|uniref:uncharacterized protein n=1 Tax=Suillus paluster TaxID=48578 RepID=UPI001B869796|nr:uncharacterized protein EDB91DRAFT_1091101 [Suillus paluster]KAG1717352.1 hypothetical protein EDB91DRAFT_1091101 [Suillus paluster]